MYVVPQILLKRNNARHASPVSKNNIGKIVQNKP